MKLWETAELFNVGSDSAVSRSIARVNELLVNDRELKQIFKGIDQNLTPLVRIFTSRGHQAPEQSLLQPHQFPVHH